MRPSPLPAPRSQLACVRGDAGASVWREFDRDSEITVHDDNGNPAKFIIPAGTMTYIPITTAHTSPKNSSTAEEEISQVGEETRVKAKASPGAHHVDSTNGDWSKPVLPEMRVVIAHLVRRYDLLPGFHATAPVPGLDYITFQSPGRTGFR
ncbi:hypothetical protein M427DRAFT_31109 [Gonapodya prolifera JEL478]|uniref:Uncharacterized protein n=1 Tax=Gonapodya prolifera (strain JEL478) TaxID=1344416 RepID=A0A139AIV8_GONPJ|nr:hypothetical protein M427DRAFT_31109 [Gonapodya prolifera JEL478]|eukprot:KXS16720.1 hypothetical protein M427DRAFT_31109 [Gonapodya prolifera JEL478]